MFFGFYFCFLFFYLVKVNNNFFYNLDANVAFFNDKINFFFIILKVLFAT